MAKSAFGATISVGGTALAELTSIGIPGKTGEVIDVSTHGSTERWREFIRGMRSLKEFSVTFFVTVGDATHDACNASIASDVPEAVVIQAAAASGTEDLTFNALGTDYTVNELEPDGTQTATFSMQPSGKMTEAPTT